MTTYERLCAYVSPRWYAYRSLLDSKYDYCPDVIERSLPKEAVDSYLGRIMSLVETINNSIVVLTPENFQGWLTVRNILSESKTFSATNISNSMQGKIIEYLEMGFQSEWIKPLLSVFEFGIYTANKYSPLNKQIYLDTLRKIYEVKDCFEPVAKWFDANPNACDEKTRYIDKEV